MKIAAVVILYHPDKTAVANIESYYDHIEKIFVFDNTETDSPIQGDLNKLSKVEYYQDFENLGIAKRLNTACNKAISQQYDWLLTMDQDSSFAPEAIAQYISCFKTYKSKENVAAFGPAFNRELMPASNECGEKEAEKLITSGMLLNLAVFATVGDFDENLFIDGVDYDYCFRAKVAGYTIVQFSRIYLRHSVGKQVYRSSVKTLFLLRKRKEIHSPLRCYYMYRNMLYLKGKYKEYDKKFIKQIRGYVLSRIKVCLLYGRDTRKILRYIQLAKRDFKHNRLGKIGKENII